MIYMDSSLLLEIYLGQNRAAAAQEILGADEAKVASWLLAVEVPVVLRWAWRGARSGEASLARALALFDEDLRGTTLYDGLPEVARRVRTDGRLSLCRASDAVHVATALLLREEAGHPVLVATFDDRMAKVARAVGLPTAP